MEELRVKRCPYPGCGKIVAKAFGGEYMDFRGKAPKRMKPQGWARVKWCDCHRKEMKATQIKECKGRRGCVESILRRRIRLEQQENGLLLRKIVRLQTELRRGGGKCFT